MSVKIVRTKEENIGDIVALARKTWPDDKWINSRFITNSITTGSVQYTALVDDKFAGCILVEEQDSPRHWIYLFAVSSEHQRKGIGTALLKKAESSLPKDSLLFVDTSENDAQAQEFYAKHGFAPTGSFDRWFENRERAVFMAKIIK